MSKPIIKVEGLGKRYVISHEQRESYTALRDVIGRKVRSLTSGNKVRTVNEDFWALKDISFEINPGDAVGIIGRNGAGKSTLLKLLSRITEPSTGRIEINGRIASLLEVGTGFHPELTGRENIFLNGAILGMSRSEIKRKFDEIVEFSGVEKFLDTPVKRYSSGMYVRLAFSVAAHLEPEILVVDEVLAVGDAEFQKRCLGKMNEVSQMEGRTVLFVSHNLGALQSLCSSVIMLKNGSLFVQGQNVRDIVNKYYLNDDELPMYWNSATNQGISSNDYFSIKEFCIVDSEFNIITRPVSNYEKIGILIDGLVDIEHPSLCIGFDILSEDNTLLYRSLSTDEAQDNWPTIVKGQNRLVCWLPNHFLNEGNYRVVLNVSLHFIKWLYDPTQGSPTIIISISGGLSNSPFWYSARPGLLAPIQKFHKI